MTRKLLLGMLAMLLGGSAAVAQEATVLLRQLPCIPSDEHALVLVAVTPDVATGEVRVYFRREGHGDYYYVPLQRSGGGYWGLLPRPEPENHAGELFAALADPQGALVARSAVQVVPVRQDCPVELDSEQQTLVGRLTVGETVPAQKGRRLAWWECEGVVQRIDAEGRLRDDEVCRPVAVWWQRPELLAPFALVWGGGIMTMLIDREPERELSPARP